VKLSEQYGWSIYFRFPFSPLHWFFSICCHTYWHHLNQWYTEIVPVIWQGLYWVLKTTLYSIIWAIENYHSCQLYFIIVVRDQWEWFFCYILLLYLCKMHLIVNKLCLWRIDVPQQRAGYHLVKQLCYDYLGKKLFSEDLRDPKISEIQRKSLPSGNSWP
jgi:hypothetical protein